jgi:hypothetical protein
MDKPALTDYVNVICTLFNEFVQVEPAYESKLYTYSQRMMIVFFVLMQYRRIYRFKTQRRWLEQHPEMVKLLRWSSIPHRITLARRYRDLYTLLQALIQFIGQDAESLDMRLRQQHLVEDKSLFKAQGPVWHQSDRQVQRIPEKLRNLDTEASWSKSGYHGWVYGYGLHLTCNQQAFPALVQVETACVAETTVLDQKAAIMLEVLQPTTLAADNSYAQALRIRRWAQRGVVLLSPAAKWKHGRYAKAYHRYLKHPANIRCLRKRRTTIEPLFDLIAKVLGTTAKQKQLPIHGLHNVRSCLALATFSVQIAMIGNSMWRLPLRNISTMAAAFS